MKMDLRKNMAVAAFAFGPIAVVGGLMLSVPAFRGYADRIYDGTLRGALFAGFLSMGGFLLTLKTFAIVHIKEKIYEDDEYRKEMAGRRAIDKDVPFYGTLRRLARFLGWSTLFALLTAFSQLTFGLLHKPWASAVCIWLAVSSLYLVLFSWVLIQMNLSAWFKMLERKAKGEGAHDNGPDVPCAQDL